MGIDALLKAAPPRYTAQVASLADKIDLLRGIGWSWGDIATALAPDLGWQLPAVDQSVQSRILGERLRIAIRGARAAIAVGKLKPEQPKTIAAPEPQRLGVDPRQDLDVRDEGQKKAASQTMESESSVSRASYLLGLDLERLNTHESAAGAALDLEPHSSKIAEMLQRGIPPTTMLKIVGARLGISHDVAAHAIQICLDGIGVEFNVPPASTPTAGATQ